MFTLHCTKKLLDRIHPEVVAPCTPTTRLGNWYATALFWKPQMALLVNERTLLPVVMPLAPAATLVKRFPAALKDVLQALDLPADFIQAEIDGMDEVVYAKTANRSLIGMSPMARSNSPTRGHPKFPQAGRTDYDGSDVMAMRAAASLSR